MKYLTPLLLLLSSVCIAQEESPIKFPMIDDSKERTITEPKPIGNISFDRMYIIEGQVPIFFRTIPDGIVEIVDLRSQLPEEMKTAPVVLREVFADGDGTKQIRVFNAPYLYIVSAKKAGTTHLVSNPKGNEVDALMTVVPLTIDGTGPNPPPDPKPKPEPVKPNKVSISIVEDTLNRSPDTAIVLSNMVYWSELVDNGNDWRVYDNDTTEPQGIKAVQTVQGQILPAIVIRDKEKLDDTVFIGPLPSTPEETKKLISSFIGGN